MHRDELAAWLTLLSVPGLGRTALRRLLGAYRSPERVFTADLREREGMLGTALARALAGHDAGELVERTEAWLAAVRSRAVVALGEPAYPRALLETADPPLLLYVEGRIELLGADCVAVVGSRNPTAQGRDNARAFASALADAGYTVVSGLALGIDAAAHEGALGHPASTIAVVGTGLDLDYPAANRHLAARIREQGLIVGEFALGTPPLRQNFPLRNRVIAGLTRGTLVVEAAPRSGSLITARLAAEAGREVFAVPGSIHSPQSRGCHALIQQGAKLVHGASDIIDELQPIVGGPRAVAPPGEASSGDPLLDAMGYDPIGMDALSARTGWSAGALAARLLELELEGRVARLPGQRFQRRASA